MLSYGQLMDEGALLRCESVSARYSNKLQQSPALLGVDALVRPHEVLAVCGPNGSGKSTLMRVMMGLMHPFEGRVVLADGQPLRRPLGCYVSLSAVAQTNSLDEKMTVQENLLLAGLLHGVSRSAARPRISELMESFSLANRLSAPVRSLSGGQKRKVDIARALLSDPEILTLDEPGIALDAESNEALWRLLRERLASAEWRLKSIVMISHSAQELENADRLLFLSGGRVGAFCSREEVDTWESFDSLTLRTFSEASSIQDQVVAALQEKPSRQSGRELQFQIQNGHSMVPRLFEDLGSGVVESIELRRENILDKLQRRGMPGVRA